jgi:hypothetical protein
MAVTTVRPNATASGSTLFTLSGGALTLHAATNDDSDSTFFSKDSSIVGQASALLDFGTTTISASQRVKAVRIRVRLTTPTAAGRINVYLGSRANNQNFFHSALAIRGAYTSNTTFTGPYQTAAPNGADWSQATIDGLRAKVTEYNDTGVLGDIKELYIDVDIVAQPTVTVSAPTGTITNSAAPDVTWAYADTDNETQAYYEIKVFTAAQYGAGGFDALTSTPTYTSGEVASSDQTAVVGDLLVNGTYRAYVRVAKVVNGSPFFSDFAFSQFTLNNTIPTVPTLSASWSSTLGKATLTVTGVAVGVGLSSQQFEVYKSVDAGVTYTLVRDGYDLTPNASFEAEAVDYEAPRGVVVYYQARAIGIDASSNEFPSGYSTVQQVLITTDNTWWFKAIENPSINLGSVRVLGQLDTNIEEPNIVFRPLGSTLPIVVAGPLQGEDGIYQIKTITATEWDNFYPILNYQGVLLVQDPLEDQKYIRITGRTFTAESVQDGTIHRNIDLAYVEVSGVVEEE